ncbi:HNH endonuclease [Streptomyces sp. 796.1]|uniref:HNH endonuclease n=1 Tax=Streptomyces sp. 796.1 TaxID=3163029 RepID=UPI0039C9733F
MPSRGGRPWRRIQAHLRATGTHVCWLCGKPIDMSIAPNDPWSWTIDHVVPYSLAPELYLEINNLREAHHSCNSSRGARLDWHKPINSTRW